MEVVTKPANTAPELPGHQTSSLVVQLIIPCDKAMLAGLAKASAGRTLVTKAAKEAPVGITQPAANIAAANKPAKTPGKATAKPLGKPAAEGAADPGAAAKTTTAAASGKGKGKAADAVPKAPRAKNAFMFFTADKREAVKGQFGCRSPA